MTPDRVERQILIHAPVDVVWSVVTDPAHISGWFSDVAELELRPGGRMVLRWDRYGSVNGRVERVDPPRLFSFRWVVPRTPGAEVGDENSTLVEFSLSAEGESTRLKVVESGFRGLGGSDEDRQGHVDAHREGWQSELDELIDYAERR
jgi:uncharacterized protein YndB with AHSA1/START domain